MQRGKSPSRNTVRHSRFGSCAQSCGKRNYRSKSSENFLAENNGPLGIVGVSKLLCSRGKFSEPCHSTCERKEFPGVSPRRRNCTRLVIRPPFIRACSLVVEHPPCTREIGVRFPSGPIQKGGRINAGCGSSILPRSPNRR